MSGLNRNKALARRIIIFALIVITALLAGGVAPAQANGIIVVNTLADDNIVNGNCTMREAIIAADTHLHRDACAAGTGSDTISFAVSGITIILSGLPHITANNFVTISGSNNVNIVRNTGDNMFTVDSSAGLFMKAITVTSWVNQNHCFMSLGKLWADHAVINCDMKATAGEININNSSLTYGSSTDIIDTTGANVRFIAGNSTFQGTALGSILIYLGTGPGSMSHTTVNAGSWTVGLSTQGSMTVNQGMFKGTGVGDIVSFRALQLYNTIVTGATQVGISVSGGTALLDNSTVMNNVDGLTNDLQAVTTLENTVFYNTSADCLISSGSIVDNGGNMQTAGGCGVPTTPDPIINGGTFSPMMNSPLIDAGVIQYCTSVDYYGVVRPVSTDGCDIGAVEDVKDG